MINEIKEIAELQLHYSSDNTPEMERRGVIIRSELPDAIRKNWIKYKNAIDRYSNDLNIEGSDGIGRKTQAPWVRLYSKELSPSATTGFYLVIHFSTNGKYFFITLGCGASRWDSNKGDLVKYSDYEISKKVAWALDVLIKEKLDFSEFNDQIDIGSHNSLPKSFEKATIICKKFDVYAAKEIEVSAYIIKALSLLSVIYDYCSELSDLPQSDIATSEIEAAVNPIKKNPNARQGYGLSAPEKKAVELRAMEVTRQHLVDLGYKITDKSANNPFDFLAEKDVKKIKVEVKGTTSAQVDSIMMTSNEVELHKNESGTTALAIVREIQFKERGINAECTGGILEYIYPWDIEKWNLEPKAYLVIKP